MTQAAKVARQVRYKVETTFNTAPGTSGGQLLRNVDSDVDMDKEGYESNENREDYQDVDFRHGVRSTAGTIKGELSPGTYADFVAIALRKDFAAVAALTGLSVTIAVGAIVNGQQQYTVTRSAGSFLTGGVKNGDVGRLSVGVLNAANINKNLYVISLTATVLTVVPLNGVALVAEGPIASTTFTVVGKKTFTPLTGHTDKSMALEHWYSDIAQSELFTGCKFPTIDVALPPTGMATIDIAVMGTGSVVPGTAEYYVAPAASTVTGIQAAVNGLLFADGAANATVTGLTYKIEGNHAGDPVVGSNIKPSILPGKVKITGQLTAFFTDANLRDKFWNETEMALSAVLSADNSAAADFIAFNNPRIKLIGAKRSVSGNGFILTAGFRSLRNLTGGAGTATEQTTMSIQDSAAP